LYVLIPAKKNIDLECKLLALPSTSNTVKMESAPKALDEYAANTEESGKNEAQSKYYSL